MKRHVGATALLLAGLASTACLAEDALPENVYGGLFGVYAPAGDCARSPRIGVGKGGLTIDLAGASESVSRPEIAHSYGGPDYRGRSVWIFPWSGQERPVLFTFNAGEQDGRLEVTAHDHGWSGGPPLSGVHKELVQASPYQRCR